MTIPSGYLVGSREAASRAGREARPDQMTAPRPNVLVPAVITELQGGLYQVGVYGDDGEIAGTIDGVSPYPDATLAVDDSVWLLTPEGRSRPVILVTGAGNGGFGEHFYQGLNDLGFAGMVVE